MSRRRALAVAVGVSFNVGGHASGSGIHGYMEEGDVNGYAVNWYSTEGEAWSRIDVDFTGVCASSCSLGEWDAIYSPTTGGHYLVGQAYFPISNGAYYDETDGAQTETYYSSSGNCATITPYEYFGATDSGSYAASSELEYTLTGSDFYPVNDSSDFAMFHYPHYGFASLDGYGAFGTWGG